MRNASVFFCLVTVVLFLAGVTGCKGPEGPAGPAGTSAGSTALEGFAPNIQCGTCHTAEQDTVYHVQAREYQWAQSKHANGGDSERNSSSCAGCHTTEGFIQRMGGQAMSSQGEPSPIGCFACHSPHQRGNFTLRKSTPVLIASQIATVPDATFDYGPGNLCVQCHQTRSLSPKPDPTKTAQTDSLVITTARWYPHYGVQGQMLMGEGGFKFPDYAYQGNSIHSSATIIKQQGCPTCHMAEPVYPPDLGAGKAGGHTMNMTFAGEGGVETELLTGCKQSGCHASISSLDFPGPSTTPVGAQTAITANLDTLYRLIVSRGWIETDQTSANYGLVKIPASGKLVIKPAIKAGALYNYFFVENDMSEGVHNTRYALDLLRSSIGELRKP
jgi:hypothetical protein